MSHEAPVPAAPAVQALLSRTRNDLTRRIQALAAELDEGRAQRGFEQLLQGLRHFWRYSILNILRISQQRPEATAVMGRRQWQAAGRTVREGAEPILILAPRSSTTAWPLVVVEVFDIAQTDGPERPPADLLSTGGCEHVQDLERAARRLKVEVKERAYLHVGLRRVHGVATGRHEITIEARLTGAARASVLLHELGHALLHFDEENRSQLTHALVETEAEAVAHVVQGVLGLPSHAPLYIAWMGGDARTVMRSLQRIQVAAKLILDAMAGRRCRATVPRFRAPSSSRGRLSSRMGSQGRGAKAREAA